MPSRLGALAGRYILTRLLGEDAAVATYEGLDGVRDQPVLIKLLPKALTADPVRQEQLRHLMDRLATLEHPNLLSAIEGGLEDGVPYLIAKEMAATPLAEKLGQALDVEQVASIVSQVGEALTYALRQGLIHGNLSPRNVLLTASDHVLVSDLGLESVLETPWEQVQEAIVPYLAPERIQGWLPGARADVYALGVILYEMLTGLQLDGPAEQALPWLREIAPAIAPDLEPVLARALATDPEARYANVGEFMADLKPILARYIQPQESPRLAEPAPRPAPGPSKEPALASLPSPALIAPALEGIPAIPMPEPPPVPTFDWDAFSLELARVPLPEPPPPPEPPPFPEVTSEGIELPVVTPVVFGEPALLPEEEKEAEKAEEALPSEPPTAPPAPLVPKPQKASPPARLAARPVQRAQRPARSSAEPVQPTPSPVKPSSQRQPPTVAALRVGRPIRIVFLTAAILFLMLSCCCWILLTTDVSDKESTPASYHISTPFAANMDAPRSLKCPSAIWA